MDVVLLHGLFGGVENWDEVVHEMMSDYDFLIPTLPINKHDNFITEIAQLTEYVKKACDRWDIDKMVLGGNSLGGQVAIDFYLKYPERVSGLILTGSAGLHEKNLADGKRPKVSRKMVEDKAGEVFYDKRHVTPQLIEDIYSGLTDRQHLRFILKLAKAARNRNVRDELKNIHVPSLLIWGRDDRVTPCEIAEEFADRLDDCELYWIEDCGHSPQIEHPKEFAEITNEWLKRTYNV